MSGESSFASHQPNPLPEPYAQKGYQPYSDDQVDTANGDALPPPVGLPHTDFETYYSDFSNFDTELEPNFLDVQDLGIAQPPVYTIPATDPGPFYPAARLSQFAAGLPSDPPEMPTICDQSEPYDSVPTDFGDLPSSPPGSPHKVPVARGPLPPPMPELRANLDMLGISHPYGHFPRASISRIIPSEPTHVYVSGSGRAPLPMPAGPVPAGIPAGVRSPYAVPPAHDTPASPYALQRGQREPVDLPVLGQMGMTSLLQPPHSAAPRQLRSMPSMPNLSPTLSDASSVSPDPGSPDGHDEDGFTWQPVLTIPRSEQSEAIIEQQRKPKQKRRSCLPDGVVEEYVGATEYEGVYMCLYPNCQRLFKRTYNLRSHVQTHLCDRPYICKVCHSNFVRPHDLRRHERCHSTDKPFVCPCGKRFNRQDALQRHRLREICEGAIHTGIPKSPKPRGRPKGRKNTPTTSPDLSEDVKEDHR